MKKQYRLIYLFLPLLTFYFVIIQLDVFRREKNIRQTIQNSLAHKDIPGAAQLNPMDNSVEYYRPTPIVLKSHNDDSVSTREKIHK